MNIKKIKKWIYKHQVETIVIMISILAYIIGGLALGFKAIIIVAILDLLIFYEPTLYQKIINYINKDNKSKTKINDINKNSKSLKQNTTSKVNKINKESVKEHMSKSNIKKNTKKTINSSKSKDVKTISKPKSKKKKWWKVLLMICFVCFIVGMIAMCAFFGYIAINAPKFNPDELFESEATIIYDNNNEIYAKLGAEKREKISYDDLPEVFVDALVATEDSRFFQHNGFDLPRFAKATVGQILGNSAAGGASTLTMQVSKNAFTSTESSGIQGIIRKFTDIYMSIFQIEKKYTKQEIIEFYVNNNCLGGSVYGVEQASLSYFGKNAKDMNLSEAALVAGLFQSPNSYNPLTKPENAAYRRKIVLMLMVRHGYITQEEADAANAISIEDLVKNGAGYSDDTKYQGFVDTVVSEVKKDTGLNPYTTSMEIYTTMDRSKQDAINDIMSGKTYDWENDVVQAGITVLDTKTGALAAVGTNRDDSASGLLNHATFENQNKRQIGSTAKPLFDYAPAIEYNNASPAQLVSDEPYQYSDGHEINNFDGGYQGIITYRTALAGSRNIPALKVFQSVKKSNIIEFVTNLGLSPEVSGNSLHEAHSIGGYNGESPVTIAAAYAAFGNGGKYNEPYSYTKIIYRDTDEEFTNPSMEVSKQAMSEATAYIVQDMLVTTAPTALGSHYSIVNGWRFSAKTGTSNFSQETKDANHLADDAINDLWVAAFNDQYTISVWYGYDKIYSDHYTHFGNMQHAALFNAVAYKVWTRSSDIHQPSSVVSVAYETQSPTPMLPSENTPSSLIATELFKKGAEPTEVSTRFDKLSNVTNVSVTNAGVVSWTGVTAKWLDSSFIDSYYGTISGSYPGSIKGWNSSVLGSLGYDIYVNDGSGYELDGTTTSTSYTLEGNYSGSITVKVVSAYTKYKKNESSGTTKTANVSSTGKKQCNITTTNNAITITSANLATFDLSKYVTTTNCSSVSITIDSYTATSNSDAATYIKGLNAGAHTILVSSKESSSAQKITLTIS